MRDRRGFALIAALGLLVALSALGLGMGFRLRLGRLAVANSAEHRRAAAAADGCLAALRARLSEAMDTGADRWKTAELFAPDTSDAGEARAIGTAADLGARLNLNRAREEELRRLFVALRIDAGVAERLAQAIADWRDGDDLRRARGAESADYERQAMWTRPANADFEQLSQLESVLGMTPELHIRIRDFLTVRGTGRVNLNAAPRPVLLALPGMTEGAVRVLESRRDTRRPVLSLSELQALLPAGSREALLPEIPALESRVVFETRELEVICQGEAMGSPTRAVVRAVLARTPNEAVVIWRQSR